MGSKTFEGVRFAAYTDDHLPPHVHGLCAETEVILDLIFAEKEEDREVRLANRNDQIRPKNAKQSDVNRILRAARKYSDELFKLWEDARS